MKGKQEGSGEGWMKAGKQRNGISDVFEDQAEHPPVGLSENLGRGHVDEAENCQGKTIQDQISTRHINRVIASFKHEVGSFPTLGDTIQADLYLSAW